MKTIAVILPFEKFYPPANGGMLRCFHLLRQLCRRFRVLAVTYQDSESFAKARKEYPELANCQILSAIPPPAEDGGKLPFITRLKHAVLFRWRNRSFSGPANTHFLYLYPVLNRALHQEKIQAVIFEEISVLSLSKLPKRLDPQIKLIYDAHNVNATLARTDLRMGRITTEQYAAVERAEKNIALYTPDLFACSESDLETLTQLNDNKVRGIVVPNGVNLRHRNPKTDRVGLENNRLLFCGSLDYAPNQEGLAWFCREVFPVIRKSLPAVQLHVIGSGIGGQELRDLLDQPGITNHGFVEDVTSFYGATDIAIVPLLSGSGTRLKLLEAMSYAIAVVSTTVGAEGIAYSKDIDISIADDAETFAGRITGLLHDNKRLNDMAEAGFELVSKKYNWDNIGDRMNKYLEQLTA